MKSTSSSSSSFTIKKDNIIAFISGCMTVFVLLSVMKVMESPASVTHLLSPSSSTSHMMLTTTEGEKSVNQYQEHSVSDDSTSKGGDGNGGDNQQKPKGLKKILNVISTGTVADSSSSSSTTKSIVIDSNRKFPLTYREDEEPDVMFPTYRAFYRHYAALLNLSCDPRVKLLRFCANQDEVDAVYGLTARDRVLKLEYLNLLAEYLIAQVIVNGRPIVRALNSPRNQQRLLNEPKARAFAKFVRETRPAQRKQSMKQAITSQKTGLIHPIDLAPFAKTMTYHGIESMRKILTIAKERGLPGHFLEAGVWRGGLSMFSRAVLNLLYEDVPEDQKPHVWVCDSFEGLPTVRSELSIGEEGYHDVKPLHGVLSVPLEIVMHNFKSFGLYNRKNTHFAKGYFIDSLPIVRADLIKRGIKLSVLRADGDMYESTIDILYNLYDLVEVGGIIIIDDWGWGRVQWMARVAVEDFFEIHGLWEDHHMVDVDGSRAYFTKAREIKVQKWRYDQSLELTKKYKKEEEEQAQSGIGKRKFKGGDARFQKFPVRPFDDGLRSIDQGMHDKHRQVWDAKRAEIKAEENVLLEKYWYVDESDDYLSQ